jgi:uridine phosphorylase
VDKSPLKTELEELFAFVVKKYFSVGTPGTIQKNVNIGDIFVCEKSIRNEGTSFQYLKSTKFAYGSTIMIDKMKEALNGFHHNYKEGARDH